MRWPAATFRSPLVIGDRLDTDIAGANAAGLPSLLVLTGVSTAADMVRADAEERPTYVGADLRSLYDSADTLRIAPASGVAGRRRSARRSPCTRPGSDAEDALTVVRATASAVWSSGLDGRPFAITGGDDTARQALEQWSLLSSLNRLA